MNTSCTIKEIFGAEGLRHNVIYVVLSDDSTAEYVGMAGRQTVAERLTHHIGHRFKLKANRSSRFSDHLFENHPEYFHWTVRMFSISEAQALTGDRRNCLPCAERAIYAHYKPRDGAINGNASSPRAGCKCNR
jgi:hypothetical protein